LPTAKNVIAALLAPGWYSTSLEWTQQPNNYGDTPPALLAQLRIEHTDGSVEWVTTDDKWQANTSYILHSEIYDGESQNARLKQPGWKTAAFNASQWKKALAIRPQAGCDRGAGFSTDSRRADHGGQIRKSTPARRIRLRLLARIFLVSCGCASKDRQAPMCGCALLRY